MKGVILAAGRGTRLLPLTRQIPKPLLPVAGKPLLHRAVEDIVEAGIQNIVLVLGEGIEIIEGWIAAECALHWPHLTVEIVHQEPLLGTGHACLAARTTIGEEPFILAFGDNAGAAGAASALTNSWRRGQSCGVLGVLRSGDPSTHAVVWHRDGQAVEFVERPGPGGAHPGPKVSIFGGAYLLTKDIFPSLECVSASASGEFYLVDAVSNLIRQAARFQVAHIPEPRTNVNTAFDLIAAQAMRLAMQGIHDGVALPSASVDPSAALSGGSWVSDHCIVGSDSVLDQCLLMEGARVGTGAHLRRVLVMPGAVVPDGVHVEDRVVE